MTIDNDMRLLQYMYINYIIIWMCSGGVQLAIPQESGILPDNVHYVRGNDSLVVFASLLLTHAQQFLQTQKQQH